MFTVETDRLFLRPFIPADFEAYYAQVGSDPAVMRYLPAGKPLAREKFQTWLDHFTTHWAQHGFGFMAVLEKSTGLLIGHAGLQYLRGRQEIEVGYALGKAYWGQGLATEAAAALLRCGFEHLGLERIVAVAFPANRASQQVMQKIGMVSQGLTHAFETELAYYTLDRSAFVPRLGLYKLTET